MSLDMGGMLRAVEKDRCRPIVVASHPRSGTHLCIDTLRINFQPCWVRKGWFEPADGLYLSIDGSALEDQPGNVERVSRILSRAKRPIVKTHALSDLHHGGVERSAWTVDPQFADWLNERSSFIYIYRDGRDVLRSLYHYMQPIAPEARVPFSQFIRQRVNGVSRVGAWARHVRSWRNRTGVFHVKMEELVNQPFKTLNRLAADLDLPPAPEEPQIPRRCDADFLSRAWRRLVPAPSSTAIVPRREVAEYSTSRQAFSQEADRRFFHAEAGDLLIELGYEHSADWVDEGFTPDVIAVEHSQKRSTHRDAAAAMASLDDALEDFRTPVIN